MGEEFFGEEFAPKEMKIIEQSENDLRVSMSIIKIQGKERHFVKPYNN